ncbi:MAG: hypothetical protein ACO34H_00710, partial [Candidatus Puniceispirillaceae bacterium]
QILLEFADTFVVDAYDKVIQDTQALDTASQNFADLLQSESMERAEAKLDELAATGKLDPALLLTMAKAYSGVTWFCFTCDGIAV